MNDQRHLSIQYSRYKLLSANFMQIAPEGQNLNIY